MKTEYTYIYFHQIESNPKSIWSCRNSRNHSELGKIIWYGPWRQYCFLPKEDTVFNVECLENINHFIGQIKSARKGQ